MQQDWRRDPIWQLLGIIISIIIVLVTQFNEPLLKIVIIGGGAISCIWIYLGNKQLAKFFRHVMITTTLRILFYLFRLLLCSILFFFSLALFSKANILWEKFVIGAGCILVFSFFVALYHEERPVIASVFKYAGFLSGLVGVVLMIVADNTWVKVALGIISLLIEFVTFIFSTREIPVPPASQKSYPSHNLIRPESNHDSESP